MWRTLSVLLVCAVMAGCAAPTAQDYADDTAMSLEVFDDTAGGDGIPTGLAESFVLEIPKAFFDEYIDTKWRNEGVGIINDNVQFVKLWEFYARDNTALRPSIDFKTRALLFVYDEEYYNLVRILGMQVKQGIANPVIWHTNWTLSIGGSEERQKWLARKENREEQTGRGVVQVAFLQLPRHLPPSQPGVTAVFANGRIIPVPKEP